MKDKRLDALLETLFDIITVCHYYDYSHDSDRFCTMPSAMFYGSKAEIEHPTTSCQGDIRKCEREE